MNVNRIELAILYGLADGLQSKEIAVRICRSKPTVEAYIRSLYSKLQARSRAHLVVLAIKDGLITIPELSNTRESWSAIPNTQFRASID